MTREQCPHCGQPLECLQQNEVKGVIISRALLEEYGYNGRLPTDEQLHIIAKELLEYWGVSDGFRDALTSTMSSMFGTEPNQ